MSEEKHKINEDLYSRLYNYKFESAMQYIEGEPEDVKILVTCLSNLFGNVGWGLSGSIGTLVAFALESIGVVEE